MKKLILPLLSCGLLASCGNHACKVVHSNSRTVTMEYNSAICSYSKMASKADLEAAKFNKTAVMRGVVNSRRESAFGAVDTVLFDLEEE